ncbi:MAG: suppressor of fused domain protein, partial [Polyangiales bacterium]
AAARRPAKAEPRVRRHATTEPPDQESLGWKAIDESCMRIYGDAEPLHYAPMLPAIAGGNDPLEGISVYKSEKGRPHWHFVTYGFSELHEKDSEDPDHSGFGFELTFRLAREENEERPPAWACNVLQNLARYVFRTGNPFGVGHHVPLNGPIALGHETEIHSVALALDPELGEVETPYGRVSFLQMVGITRDEAKAIKRWSSTGMLELLAANDEWLITSLDRPSLLSSDETRRQIAARTAEEGSSSSASFTSQLEFAQADDGVRLEVGAIAVEDLIALVDGRIRFGRDFSLMGHNALVTFEPAETAGWSVDASELKILVTPDLAHEIASSVKAHRGLYEFRNLPTLQLEIVPTEIKDQQGQVTEIIG